MPSRYRESVINGSSSQLIVTVDHTDRCLLIYPMQDWIKVEEQLMRLNNMNRRARNVQRLVLGHASECELDTQGRILVSAPLRKYAGLEKKVVLVGQMNKFELWSNEAWYPAVDGWVDEAQSETDMDDSLNQLSI